MTRVAARWAGVLESVAALVPVALVAVVAGCDAADAPLESQPQPRVWLDAPTLRPVGGPTFMLGHEVDVAVALHAAPGTTLPSGVVAWQLGSAQRQQACTLAAVTVTSGSAQARVVAGAGCAALVDAPDLALTATFGPAGDVAGATAANAAVEAATGRCQLDAAGTCQPLQLVASAGVDLQVQGLRLGSNVAVLEFAGPPMDASEARPAVGVPGTAGYVPARAAVDPAEFAPDLDLGPVLHGELRLFAAGQLGPTAAAWAAPDLALTLAIRPAGAGDDAWLAAEPATEPAAEPAAAASSRTAPAALPMAAPQGSESVGVPWALQLPAALRDRMTTGDLARSTLWQLRACAETTAAEASPAADARANNCQVVDFAVVRVERPYGVHRYPEVSGEANLPASDYFEIGKTETSGNKALHVDRLRGGYREVSAGHVRFGGVFWAQLASDIFPFEAKRLLTIRAFHDTAPSAPDFASGTIELLGFPTIELPKFTVPDAFKFALNAAVDTSKSDLTFDGTANLEPLVSALNFVSKQAQAGGPKFCLPFPSPIPDICLEAPLNGTLDLQVGVAFAKSFTQPKCAPMASGGCLEDLSASASHFWANAKACADRGANLPSNRALAQTVKAMRAYANAINAPFYLSGYRAGLTYHYLLSKEFMDEGWFVYGSEYSGAVPTYWAFLDASLLVENGGCALQAPDTYTKAMRVDYGVETVAKASVANPVLLELASNAHVPCQAQLPLVCEYPLHKDGTIAFERNEIYAQLAVQASINAKVEKSAGIDIKIASVSGNVSLTGNLLQTTFAATVGQRWTATLRADGEWETMGTAYGDVAIWGKLGEIVVKGEACGSAIGISTCFAVTLGGLSKLLPLDEIGVYFAATALPFHVKAGK